MNAFATSTEKEMVLLRPARPYSLAREPKIKLVFLLRSLTMGGSQRQLIGLAGRLDPSRFEIVILSLYSGGAFAEQLQATGLRTMSLGKKGRWDLFRSGARLVTLIRTLAPDILHSFSPVTNVLAALLKRSSPKTHIVWGIRGSNAAGRQLDWMEKLNLNLQSRLSSWPNLIIFNSYAGREYHLRNGISPDRLLVIPNGIDTDWFKPDPRLRERQRALWQVNEDSPLVGIVGRIASVKDHPTFLKAAALWARSAPEVRFVCIGDGEEDYIQKLRRLGCDLGLQGRIFWTGPIVEDMPSAYAGLDICCNSSRTEGSSNSIAEAMSCGVPCVVTDVGDSRHIVCDCGVVVAPGDAEALAGGLSHMSQLIRAQPEIRLRARERIQVEFSLDSLVQRTSEALLNLS